MYGSSFCIVTRRPLLFSRRPSEAAVRPLPKELATPPVTKMCFAKMSSMLGVHLLAGGGAQTEEPCLALWSGRP